MSDNPQSVAAQKLIQAFSTISSTEDLIVFVAGTDYMLSFCQELIEQHDHDNSGPIPMEISSLCASHGILPGLLYSEVRKVLIALNRFHNASRDHYATLGLPENAPTEEIKKAYRQLSKKYHPDMVHDEQHDTQQRFMEISGAYHALMARQNDTPSDGKPWRKKRVRRKATQRRKMTGLFLTIIPLVFILIGVSMFVSRKYNEQVYLGQLETSAQLAENNTVATPAPEVSEPPEETMPPPKLSGSKKPSKVVQQHIALNEPDPKDTNVDPVEQKQIQIAATTKPEVKLTADDTEPTEVPELSITKAVENTKPSEVPGLVIAQAFEDTEPADVPEQSDQQQSQPSIPIAVVQNSAEKLASQPSQSYEVKQTLVQQGETVESLISTQQSEKKNLLKTVEKILAQYTKLYNAKDLDKLLTLFHTDATENGQLQSRLIDQYKSLFSNTKSVELSLGAVLWNEFDNGLEAKCSFTACYKYNNGRIMDYIGDITFYITDEQGNYKIKALNYVFIN